MTSEITKPSYERPIHVWGSQQLNTEATADRRCLTLAMTKAQEIMQGLKIAEKNVKELKDADWLSSVAEGLHFISKKQTKCCYLFGKRHNKQKEA